MPVKRHTHGGVAAHVQRRRIADILQRGNGFFFQKRVVFQQETQAQRAAQQAHGFLCGGWRHHLADFRRGARADGRHQHIVARKKCFGGTFLRQHHVARPCHFARADLPPLHNHCPRCRLKQAVRQFLSGFVLILVEQFCRFAHNDDAGGAFELFGRCKIGRGFFQFVSRVLHQFQTMGERGFRAFVVAAAKPCLFPKSDFQTTCFLFQAVCKTVFGRRRAGIQGALLGLGGDVQQNRAVAYAAGQHMIAYQALPRFRCVRRVTAAAARGFQPEHAAVVRG